MHQEFMFSCESVTEGHPDKMCDQISDAIVDRFLQRDRLARVVAECAVANGVLFVASRFASPLSIDIPDVARKVIEEIGYTDEDFNAKDCTVMTNLTSLPQDDAARIDESSLTDEELDRVPADHMANVFGYACDQTPGLIPLPLWLAHKLARRLAAVRLKRQLLYLTPDGHAQVGVEYRASRPYRIHSITLVASQRGPAIRALPGLRDDLWDLVIAPAFSDEPIEPDNSTRIVVNPEGPRTSGGPSAHSGLTGRKNAIDTYGEYSRHAGAALSGKHPTRVDRIGVYAARHAAKNVVAAGLASECEVQLTYFIGQPEPASIQVNARETRHVTAEQIRSLVQRHFDFRPAAIVRRFDLRCLPARHEGSFYRRLAAYGHVGRTDIDLPWEVTDQAEMLR